MHKILFVFLLHSLAVASQPTSKTINKTISGAKTEKHINIPGTRLYIISPTGFVLSNQAGGLRKGNGSVINFTDSIGDNFYDFDLSQARKTYEKLGAKVIEEKTVNVHGYSGHYLLIEASANANSQVLTFGDKTFSVRIIAAYLRADKEAAEELTTALNTIYYSKEREIYPLDTAGFALDENASRFKYFGFNEADKMYGYSIDNQPPQLKSLYPFVLVTSMPDNGLRFERAASLFDNLDIIKYGVKNPIKRDSTFFDLNGYPAYRSETRGKLGADDVLLYCTIVKSNNRFFVIRAIARKDFDTNLAEFKKLIATFRVSK